MFIRAGMKFDDLLQLKESLDDPSHKNFTQYRSLEDLLEVLDDEDALNEVKDCLLIMDKARMKKRRKAPVK